MLDRGIAGRRGRAIIARRSCTMISLLVDPGFWLSLFSVTLIQIALGADNLIIITIIANKLPSDQRKKAVVLGLVLAAVFRILLLAGVAWVLRFATTVLGHLDLGLGSWLRIQGEISGKAVVLVVGGLFLIWKGIKELRLKAKGLEHEIEEADRLIQVVSLIVGMNLIFSVDSILTVVGMTDIFLVMVGSVVISVGLMLAFVGAISDFIARNPDFEILGLFVLLLIGFVLFLEGGHVAHLDVNGSAFPYIPQWIVIFILLLMFSVDLYQNWLERKQAKAPVELRRRKK
jgi:predicted tellurium resistance membrane protein TerC